MSIIASHGSCSTFFASGDRFTSTRRILLKALIDANESTISRELAEEFADFDILLTLLDALDDRDTHLAVYRHRYGSDAHFDHFMFRWYIDRGRTSTLFARVSPQHDDASLAAFVADKAHLRWQYEARTNKMYKACHTLAELAFDERTSVTRKRTMLSLCILHGLSAIKAQQIDNEYAVQKIVNEARRQLALVTVQTDWLTEEQQIKVVRLFTQK